MTKELCQNDLKFLCKDILGMSDWDVIHDELQSFLDNTVVTSEERNERGRQFRLIMIPRGHLKTSIVTKGWVIQQFLRNHNIRILIANAVWNNARKIILSIQTYLTQSKLKDYFGSFRPKNKNMSLWNKDAFIVEQREMVQEAATVTSCGVGSELVGQHYDIIVLDDVVARENITTPEQRDKVKAFYADCLNMLEPNGIVIVVGTTWHEDDLYASLEDKKEHPEYAIFKRVAEQGTEESVIFPKKFSLKLLKQIRGNTPESNRFYSAQYLLNPYPDEDMEFKQNWIRYWNELPKEPMYVSVTLDPSLGKDTSDWSAITAVGRTFERKSYVIEARHFRRKVEDIPQEVVKTVRNLVQLGYSPSVIGLEAYGFQQTLLQPIQKALREAGLPDYVELLPVNVKQGKSERIRALIPKFSGYEVFLHNSQQDLVREMLKWNPDVKGRSDDIIDSLAWHIHYWDRKPGQSVRKESTAEWSLDWWIKNHVKKNEDKNFILGDFR